jgi:hypothetical protein
MVTWFAPLFIIQAYGRFWKSGIMYISILSLCLWKSEALNSKNINTMSSGGALARLFRYLSPPESALVQAALTYLLDVKVNTALQF